MHLHEPWRASLVPLPTTTTLRASHRLKTSNSSNIHLDALDHSTVKPGNLAPLRKLVQDTGQGFPTEKAEALTSRRDAQDSSSTG